MRIRGFYRQSDPTWGLTANSKMKTASDLAFDLLEGSGSTGAPLRNPGSQLLGPMPSDSDSEFRGGAA